MQDDYAHSRRSPIDALVTIPADIVDWLRQAAYTEIGLTAETLDTAAFSTDREAHPAWFRGPAETLRDIYALLDTIGWSKSTPPHGQQIDPSGNSWTLIRTLIKALEIADQDTSGTTPSASTHTKPGAPTPNADTERANALWNFIASIEAYTDTLAVENRTDDLLDIAA
jgi:hypothetical protein